MMWFAGLQLMFCFGRKFYFFFGRSNPKETENVANVVLNNVTPCRLVETQTHFRKYLLFPF